MTPSVLELPLLPEVTLFLWLPEVSPEVTLTDDTGGRGGGGVGSKNGEELTLDFDLCFLRSDKVVPFVLEEEEDGFGGVVTVGVTLGEEDCWWGEFIVTDTCMLMGFSGT